MNLGQSIRSGTNWLFAGNVGQQILHFAFSVILARLLVPADFGMLVTVSIFTGVAGFIASGGMGQALVQAKEASPRDFQIVFTIQLIFCVAIYSFFFVIAPFFAAWFEEPLYEDLLRVSALSFLMRPFASIPNSWLQREMRFKDNVIVGAISLIVSGVVSVSLAIFGYGVWSLIFGGLVGGFVSAVGKALAARWLPGLAWDLTVAKRLGNYGFKVTINNIVLHFRTQTPNLIISHMLGSAAVGLYNKGASLAAKPMNIIGKAPYKAVFRALSKIQDNLDQSRYIYYRTVTLVLLYTLPFYVTLWWIGEPLVRFIYGEHWAEAGRVLEIIAIGGLFRCFTNPSGAVVEAQKQMGKEFWIEMFSWSLLVGLIFLMLDWGLEVVAFAVVLGTALHSLLMVRLAMRTLRGKYSQLARAVKPVLCLNMFLFMGYLLFDQLIPFSRADEPAFYAMAMVLSGGTLYALIFLGIPIASLKSESMRWRVRLQLSRSG